MGEQLGIGQAAESWWAYREVLVGAHGVQQACILHIAYDTMIEAGLGSIFLLYLVAHGGCS